MDAGVRDGGHWARGQVGAAVRAGGVAGGLAIMVLRGVLSPSGGGYQGARDWLVAIVASLPCPCLELKSRASAELKLPVGILLI